MQKTLEDIDWLYLLSLARGIPIARPEFINQPSRRSYALKNLCIAVFAAPSGGLSVLGCGIVGRLVGEFTGGKIGEAFGEVTGEVAYDWVP